MSTIKSGWYRDEVIARKREYRVKLLVAAAIIVIGLAPVVVRVAEIIGRTMP